MQIFLEGDSLMAVKTMFAERFSMVADNTENSIVRQITPAKFGVEAPDTGGGCDGDRNWPVVTFW